MRVAVEASPNLAAEHDESLRPFSLEFRVGRGFASLCCPKGSAVDVGRARLRLPRAGERRHQRGIAAQRRAVGCGSVDDHIEATPIISAHPRCRGVDQPLLGHDLAFGTHGFSGNADPRVFECFSSPREKSGARASEGMVTELVHVAPAAVCWAASAVADGERHAQAAA